MKTLEKKIKRYKNIIFNLILCLLAFLTLFICLKINNELANKNKRKIKLLVNSTLNLAEQNVSYKILSIKRYLYLLSTIPTLKIFTRKPILTNKVKQHYKYLNKLIKVYRPFIGFAYADYLKFSDTLVYWSQIFEALVRRMFLIYINPFFPSAVKNYENSDQLNVLQPINNLNKHILLNCKKKTDFIRKIPTHLNLFINKLKIYSMNIANFLDIIFGFNMLKIKYPAKAENLLAVALSSNPDIMALNVKNIDGQFQIGVSNYTSFFNLGFSNHDHASPPSFMRPFVCGPVTYEESLSAPVWHVYLPLRNKQRIINGYISATINLKFLSEIAQNYKANPNINLFFVDNNGIVIGHTDKSMITKQINLTYANPIIKKALSGNRKIEIFNSFFNSYTAGYRFLHNFKHINNPNWAIIIMANTKAFSQNSNFFIRLSLIMLAVISIYVLIYASKNMLIYVFNNGENFNVLQKL